MNGWMGWMDGHVNEMGCVDEWMDGWMHNMVSQPTQWCVSFRVESYQSEVKQLHSAYNVCRWMNHINGRTSL